MKELDLLKKNWNKQENNFEQVSELEIYHMIHKKSSSIVKWIFVISILEVLFWISVSLIFNTDDEIKNLQSNFLKYLFHFLTYINYGVIGAFIYFFYKNYTRISATASTKQLMKDILKTRKTVQFYVWYNLGILAFSLVLGLLIVLIYNPQTAVLKDTIMKSSLTILFSVLVITLIFAIFIGVFWLFYRLLYGILLKKLYDNYNELKKIDL